MPTDYEHIVPFSECKEHTAENITLLCKMHHQEVSSKRLAKRVVKLYNDKPFARTRGIANYCLTSDQMEVRMGQFSFSAPVGSVIIPFDFSNLAPLQITVSQLGLLYNAHLKARNGKDALVINENSIDFKSSNLWDVELTGTRLEIKYGSRQTLLKLKIEDGVINIQKLALVYNGYGFMLDGTSLVAHRLFAWEGGFKFETEEVGVWNMFGTALSKHFTLLRLIPKPFDSDSECWEALDTALTDAKRMRVNKVK